MAQMQLTGMLAAFERIVADAAREQIGYTDFLDAMLQAELDARTERAAARRLQAAKLPVRVSLDDFDYTAKRSITKAQIREIHSLGWLKEGRPLVLIGQTGVGKSYIAQAVALHVCQQGRSALYMSVTTWLENLNLARSSGTYLRYREKLVKPDVLILDDIGMRKLTATEAQDLCEILEERSFGKSTVFTTQLPLEHWAEVIADPVIADAIRDRLQHAALMITITGESYRGVKARKLAGRSKDS
jgi:DNA replication protein DnaC